MGRLRATARPQARATRRSPEEFVEEVCKGWATARYRSRLMAVRVKMEACMVSRSKLSSRRQPSSPKAQPDARLSYTIKGAVKRYNRSAQARLSTCRYSDDVDEDDTGEEVGDVELDRHHGNGALMKQQLAPPCLLLILLRLSSSPRVYRFPKIPRRDRRDRSEQNRAVDARLGGRDSDGEVEGTDKFEDMEMVNGDGGMELGKSIVKEASQLREMQNALCRSG
uniref:Uncharacterized protein n=1 Tax=Knipowitschia caucasica TaxID=637954 RepID=A0AAV2MCK4_KNICA